MARLDDVEDEREKRPMDESDLIEAARRAAALELLPTDTLSGEVAAFDILLNGLYVGHWSQTPTGSTASWVRGPARTDTGRIVGGEKEILAALRKAIPTSYLDTD